VPPLEGASLGYAACRAPLRLDPHCRFGSRSARGCDTRPSVTGQAIGQPVRPHPLYPAPRRTPLCRWRRERATTRCSAGAERLEVRQERPLIAEAEDEADIWDHPWCYANQVVVHVEHRAPVLLGAAGGGARPEARRVHAADMAEAVPAAKKHRPEAKRAQRDTILSIVAEVGKLKELTRTMAKPETSASERLQHSGLPGTEFPPCANFLLPGGRIDRKLTMVVPPDTDGWPLGDLKRFLLKLPKENAEQKREIAELRDEIARLKGPTSRPPIKASGMGIAA
jgi:hypothetical protein